MRKKRVLFFHVVENASSMEGGQRVPHTTRKRIHQIVSILGLYLRLRLRLSTFFRLHAAPSRPLLTRWRPFSKPQLKVRPSETWIRWWMNQTPRARSLAKKYTDERYAVQTASHSLPTSFHLHPHIPTPAVCLRPTVHLRVQHHRCVHRYTDTSILGLRPGPRRLLCHGLQVLSAHFRRVQGEPYTRCHKECHHQV